jgi:hypothetical protein
MPAILTVWILVSVAHPGKLETQEKQYMGVFATQSACEHALAAYSDPAYKLPTAKPVYLTCMAEHPES